MVKLQIEERLDRIEGMLEKLLGQEERDLTPEELDRAHRIARAYYETYQELASHYQYHPPDSMKVSWDNLFENKKLLMVGVFANLLDREVIKD